jgi:hypothetical protein
MALKMEPDLILSPDLLRDFMTISTSFLMMSSRIVPFSSKAEAEREGEGEPGSLTRGFLCLGAEDWGASSLRSCSRFLFCEGVVLDEAPLLSLLAGGLSSTEKESVFLTGGDDGMVVGGGVWHVLYWNRFE